MSRPVVGGRVFAAESAAGRWVILYKALEAAEHAVRYVAYKAANPDDMMQEDYFAMMLRSRVETLRGECDNALKALGDRVGEDRERELIRHLREETSGRTSAEIETAKRLADVRERKLEAGER